MRHFREHFDRHAQQLLVREIAGVIACAPLFTLLLGVSLFRERGVTGRVVLAVLLVVPGVVLISMDH